MTSGVNSTRTVTALATLRQLYSKVLSACSERLLLQDLLGCALQLGQLTAVGMRAEEMAAPAVRGCLRGRSLFA
jgi:hypothetical protein